MNFKHILYIMFFCILCSNVNYENTVHYMYTMQLVFRGFCSFLSQHNCIQDFHFDACVYAIVTIKNVNLFELFHISFTFIQQVYKSHT